MDGAHGRSFPYPIQQDEILILTENEAFHREVSQLIAAAGFRCRLVSTVDRALSLSGALHPVLLVIEGHIGRHRAVEVCQSIQATVECPLIVIDHGGDLIDRVLALELGADDYLAHPVDGREILARVRARLRRYRRSSGSISGGLPADEAHWRLDMATRQLFGPRAGRPVTLTPGEQALLVVLLKQGGRPLTPDEAFPHADLFDVPLGQLRTGVSRLRRKLRSAGFASKVIRSIPKRGYVLDPEMAASGRLAT